MSGVHFLLLAVAIWLALVAVAWLIIIPVLRNGPAGSASAGLAWWCIRAFCRLVHRPTLAGRAHVEWAAEHLKKSGRGLIVVSNHTGAIDPLLVQANCPFLIHWMMASDMMGPGLDWLWRLADLIPVDRDGRDSGPLREAIRRVQAGRCVGIFPEGRIVTPPREIRPYFPGVGMMIARTSVPVLLVWVSGTPDTNDTRKSLFTPSHARVEFIDFIEFGEERDAATITGRLRRRIAEISGWPLNDDPQPPSGPRHLAAREAAASS